MAKVTILSLNINSALFSACRETIKQFTEIHILDHPELQPKWLEFLDMWEKKLPTADFISNLDQDPYKEFSSLLFTFVRANGNLKTDTSKTHPLIRTKIVDLLRQKPTVCCLQELRKFTAIPGSDPVQVSEYFKKILPDYQVYLCCAQVTPKPEFDFQNLVLIPKILKFEKLYWTCEIEFDVGGIRVASFFQIENFVMVVIHAGIDKPDASPIQRLSKRQEMVLKIKAILDHHNIKKWCLIGDLNIFKEFSDPWYSWITQDLELGTIYSKYFDKIQILDSNVIAYTGTHAPTTGDPYIDILKNQGITKFTMSPLDQAIFSPNNIGLGYIDISEGFQVPRGGQELTQEESDNRLISDHNPIIVEITL